ncbi:Arc family DNA-binding protein [Mesorhizobium sp. B2-2-4]|nr:Arc family DNA-binding protein [Mesorhizobium sp. B2-2-4]TPM67614.1 Arc family DNA-binding protein [Mesorhizobium sp. B2-2-1]TPN66896.1 Arc family DNA-binding protein [Mesorhizobium sp. B1-1-3]
MSRSDPKFLMRLPADVKAFIVSQAARNGSSQNSEIVRCIRNRMDETKTATSEPGSSN